MIFTHADAQFRSSHLAVSAESVGGTTLGARVTWNTTLPPECVASVRVNFRTATKGILAAANTTTNISQTEIIQTGLQCGASYNIKVVVSGKPRHQGALVEQILSSEQVEVLIGGKEVVCMRFQSQKPDGGYAIAHAATPVLFGVRAEVTSDNTSIIVSWKWSCQGVINLVTVNYQPERGSLMMYTVNNIAATNATLPNLLCDTEYTVWVHARGGQINRTSAPRTISLPARGILYNMYITFIHAVYWL